MGIVEQLIKKKVTRDDYAVRIIVVLLTLTLPFVTFTLAVLYQIAFVSLAIALLGIGIYMIFYVIQNQRVEFEYIISEDNITVDKIINKSKRKNICSLTISHITLFAHIDDKRLAKKKFGKRFDVSVNIYDSGNYVACFNTPKFGECCLILTPNDEALEAIGRYLPREQRYEFRELMNARKEKKSEE